MAETYCGKSCEVCTYRESTGCAGCKQGPGKRYHGTCEIALCAQERGHLICDTCSYQNGCGKLQRKETMHRYRENKLRYEQAERKQTNERARGAGRWLWVLFWLVIPAEVAGIMQNEFVTQLAPAAYLPGVLLGVATSIVYGVILWLLRKQAEGYGAAGICTLIAAALPLLTVLLIPDRSQPVALLLTIPALILSLFAEYNEYNAHSNMLVNIDDELSEKWENLWKWYLGCMVCAICSALLVFLLSVIGALIAIAAVFGMVVIRIIKLYYLYQTASVISAYQETGDEA